MLKQSLFQGFRVADLKREHYVVFKPDFFDVSMDFRFGKEGVKLQGSQTSR